MKIHAPRSQNSARRRSAGFTLLEGLIVIGAISSVVAIGAVSLVGTQDSVKTAKLRQDVAALNSAVRTYLMSGGTLPDTASGNDVIAKLKTTTDATSRSQIAGLRGTMVDLRLRGVTSSDADAFKAVWNSTKKSFVVTKTGTGFGEFKLDESAVPTTLTEESRTATIAMNSADKWIWAFDDHSPNASVPNTGFPTTPAPVTTPTSGASMTVLLPPDFSKPPGLYPYGAYTPTLQMGLIDNNPPNTAESFYSIANGPWIRYVPGTQLSVPRALEAEVRAYSAPLDPDRYEQSATNSGLYETIFFGGGSSGEFFNPLGDSGLVSNLRGFISTLINGITSQVPKFGPMVNWGTPGANTTTPNSLTFAGKSFASVAPDEEFELGSLTYYNGSTNSGTNATSVQLRVNLNLTTPGVVESLPFTFGLLSTTNNGYSLDADADYVYIPQVSTQFNTIIKGQKFYLVLSFGDHGPNGFTTINQFHVHEGKSMVGKIYGRFTTTPPGSGMAGN